MFMNDYLRSITMVQLQRALSRSADIRLNMIAAFLIEQGIIETAAQCHSFYAQPWQFEEEIIEALRKQKVFL